MNTIELIGYLASLLVAVSLSVSSVLKLRWLNLFGALAFSIYGLLISAIPVFLVIQIYRTHDIFEMIPIHDLKAEPIGLFIKFYSKDLEKFFPDFIKENLSDEDRVYALYRNFKLIGLFGFRKTDSSIGEVFIDYVISEYRDFKFGRYIYKQRREIFEESGIQKIVTRSWDRQHTHYLRKIGFQEIRENLFQFEL